MTEAYPDEQKPYKFYEDPALLQFLEYDRTLMVVLAGYRQADLRHAEDPANPRFSEVLQEAEAHLRNWIDYQQYPTSEPHDIAGEQG